jgi:hypothetical protein
MKEFIQLKISLNESNPLIWRQIQLHKDHTFFELHHINQITMGWQNYHAYEFNVEGYRIGTVIEEDKDLGYGTDSLLDAETTKLVDVITHIGDIIKYEYDFGDGWEHTLEVEGFLDADHHIIYPYCIEGGMSCPPEDCGGIHGFKNCLEILKDKKHPEYKDLKRWMPRGYDPTKFDNGKVNKQLVKLDKYIDKWLNG